MRIAWLGFHQEGMPALRGLIDAGVRLEALITLEAEALTRRSAAANYADIAAANSIPLYMVANINCESAVRRLMSLDLDVLFVVGWSQILAARTLSTLRVGAFGTHASLLPHNRGSAPINWALIRGETSTGNTLIKLTGEVDAGEIIDQVEIPITLYDTCETLYERVAETNWVMLQRFLPRLLGGNIAARPQPHSVGPVLPRRRPEDGEIDWQQPAKRVYDFVRALTRPYPGAFSILDGKRWIIQSCALLPTDMVGQARAGEVLGPAVSPLYGACGQVVACGPGAVVVLEVEDPQGKILKGPALSAAEWTGKIWGHETQASTRHRCPSR